MQGIHAAIEISRSGNIPPSIPHPHVVFCSVRDEWALEVCCERLSANGIIFSRFIEPDRNNELTAIATAPVNGEARKLFRRLKLVKGSRD